MTTPREWDYQPMITHEDADGSEIAKPLPTENKPQSRKRAINSFDEGRELLREAVAEMTDFAEFLRNGCMLDDALEVEEGIARLTAYLEKTESPNG